MNKKVLVSDGQRSYGEPFEKFGKVTTDLSVLKQPEEVAVVVFTGGEDVHPTLYGGVYNPKVSYSNKFRDVMEIGVFRECKKHGIKMVGICRGHQFLNVMVGGELFQHMSHPHHHTLYFQALDEEVDVNSLHHQLVKPNLDTSIPLAWTPIRLSNIYVDPHLSVDTIPDKEIEVLYMPSINAMSVQYHPEMLPRKVSGRQIFDEMVELFMTSKEDFESRYVPKNGVEYVAR